MANILGDDTQQQVLALGRLGWPLRRIQAATGVRRETASAYLKAAGIPVRLPRRRRPPAPKPASQVSTDFGGLSGPERLPPWPPPTSRAPTASACEPYRELIEHAFARGRNAMAIWQDLVDDHGFPGRYASVRRFVVKLRGQRTLEPHAVIVTAPGEEGQVDYGDGAMVRHPLTRKYRRTRLFIFTLGYSRKSVRLLTFESSTRRWAELHEESFRRLGGAVRVVVQDNLREGVLTPDIYDPTLNPLYRDVLAHYGAVALPCRVGDPDRKGKVESAIGHTQATPLKGLRFETLDEAQAYLDHWETRWADTRIHGTTKRQVAAMFAEERPALPPSSPSATTATAPAPSISMAVSRSTAPTIPRRRAGSGARSPSSGTAARSACSTRPRACCCASTGPSARAAMRCGPWTSPSAPRRRPWHSWPGPPGPGRGSAPCATRSTAATAPPVSAGSWAS
jgi:transposase